MENYQIETLTSSELDILKIIDKDDHGKINGFITRKGLGTNLKTIVEAQVRQDDVWVCSFPRTGATWIQELVWCLMNDVDIDKSKSMPIHMRFPEFELSVSYDAPLLLRFILRQMYPKWFVDSFEYSNKMESPRTLKSRLPYGLLPAALQHGSSGAKIIYIARHPKDTVVSLYYYYQLVHDYDQTLDDFVKAFTQGLIRWAPYDKHVLSYWEKRKDPNILFLFYEELIKDLPSVIDKCTEFLNVTITKSQFKKLIDHLSFESMRENPSTNYEDLLGIKHSKDDVKGKFIRGGQSGVWKVELSETSSQIMDQWMQDKFDGTDLNWN